MATTRGAPVNATPETNATNAKTTCTTIAQYSRSETDVDYDNHYATSIISLSPARLSPMHTDTHEYTKNCQAMRRRRMEWSGIDRMNECTLSKRQLTADIVASPQHDRQGNITSNRDLALHDATNLCSTWACRHPIHTHTKVAPSCFRYPSVSAV